MRVRVCVCEAAGRERREKLSHDDLQLPSPATSSWEQHSLRAAPIALARNLAWAQGLGVRLDHISTAPQSAPPAGCKPCSGNSTFPCVLGLQPCLDNLSVL